jgi:PST family polysaccharide transporter
LRYLQRNADQFFVGRWFGSGALGLYGRGVQLVVLPGQYLSDPLAAWVIASLGREHDAPAAARVFWCRVVNGLAHLTLPMAVVLFCVPGEILRIAFGPAWVGGAGMLRGLSVALVAQPALAGLTWLLIATGHGRRLLWWSGATLVVVMIACLGALHAGPAALSGAASGALLVAAAGGAIFAMAGLPAGPRDLVGAVARPFVATVVAAGAVHALLPLMETSGAVTRLAMTVALVGASWALACAAPGFRGELKNHFLRRQP